MTQDMQITHQPSDQSARRANEVHMQYVTFLVGESSFGVEINLVREIKKWAQTTVLPNQPSYNRGVLNLRGTIVPVHDLRCRFGSGLTEATEDHVVVIVWIGTKTVGILVDAVSDIISVPEADIQPVPMDQSIMGEQSIGGLVNTSAGMVAILDLNTLFPSDTENEL